MKWLIIIAIVIILAVVYDKERVKQIIDSASDNTKKEVDQLADTAKKEVDQISTTGNTAIKNIPVLKINQDPVNAPISASPFHAPATVTKPVLTPVDLNGNIKRSPGIVPSTTVSMSNVPEPVLPRTITPVVLKSPFFKKPVSMV